MNTLYLVTKLSQEEDPTGIILRVDTKVFGIYTSEERADGMAAKYGGTVTPMVRDDEKTTIVEHWENPGYHQG